MPERLLASRTILSARAFVLAYGWLFGDVSTSAVFSPRLICSEPVAIVAEEVKMKAWMQLSTESVCPGQ